MTLKASLITNRRELNSLASEWNDLLRKSSSDSVFLTWEWISAWLDSVAPNAPLLTVVVRRENGQLAAIGPFYLTRMRLLGVLPYRVCRVLGDFESGAEYPDIIADQTIEEEATMATLQALLDAPEPWDCLWLPRMAGWTGRGEQMITCSRALSMTCHFRDSIFSAVSLPQSGDEYIRSLSRNGRWFYSLMKKLTNESNLTFETCSSEDELDSYLDALFSLHRQRWSLKGEEGSFVRKPSMATFYRRFAQLALQRGWLRLFALKIDGEFKAVQIGYLRGKVLSSLQEGFDPRAPDKIGNLLRALAIQSLIEEGAEFYDFLGGFTEHKRRWRAEVRKGFDMFIARDNLKTRLLFAKEVWPSGRFLVEDHPAQETS